MEGLMRQSNMTCHRIVLPYTVVCRIVRRLLISVQWQFTGMADTHEY